MIRDRMRTSLLLAGVLLGALPSCASHPETSVSATPSQAPGDGAAALGRLRVPSGTFDLPRAALSAQDDGRSRMLVHPTPAVSSVPAGISLYDAARAHLQAHADELSLDEAALDASVMTARHSLPGDGSILQFGQRVNGLEVFRARASVVMDARRNLVSLASRLATHGFRAEPAPFELTAGQALIRAYGAHVGRELAGAAARAFGAGDKGASFVAYALATPPAAPIVVGAGVKRVLFPSGGRLLPAHHVELVLRAPGSSRDQAYGDVVDAATGAVLWSNKLTVHEAFTYRVWADPNGNHTPSDGPLVDSTPYPGAAPIRARPGFSAPALITIDGFNTNPDGVPDPWLPTGATTSLGNNVTAYSDRGSYYDSWGRPRDDGFTEGDDLRAEVTAPNTFDLSYDIALAPDADDDQIRASVAQIFYTTNWLHDYWYDSGFDEASGNAQQDNFGRGGEGNDPLQAEAQDGADNGSSSNANMSVLSDGRSPRMQMYVWSGVPNRALVTEPPIAFDDELGGASYGPQTFDMSGELVLVDDGSTAVPPDSEGPGTTSDGCQSFSGMDGLIAVIDRGACLFIDKVENAQQAGAKAVVVLDNAPGHIAVNPSADIPPDAITIPLLALSYEDGQKLKAAIGDEAPLMATRYSRGYEVLLDGTLDNTIVAHEWGHYLHLRLVSCASLSCAAMSEGWGDFIALMLAIREGDTFPGQVYPLSQYASAGLGQFSGYFGVRRAPYAVDLDKNPFTFRHIRESAELPTTAPLAPVSPDMNESHNAGEIWAQMLFEAYVNLLSVGQAAGRPFEESKRRMADYVVAGLKAAPPDPTFVEQRDAILAGVRAMAAGDPTRVDDFTALAQGFAKRGLGTGAIAPPSMSLTLNEAVESFEMFAAPTVTAVAADDSLRSCNRDGALGAGEAGQLKLSVANLGWHALEDLRVEIESSDPSVQLDDAGIASVGRLDPYGQVDVTLGVSVRATAAPGGKLRYRIVADDTATIEGEIPADYRVEAGCAP